MPPQLGAGLPLLGADDDEDDELAGETRLFRKSERPFADDVASADATNIATSLRRDGGVLRTLATITDATVNLPQITAAASKNLQPTKPLDDVVFVDGRALREEAQRVKVEKAKEAAK